FPARTKKPRASAHCSFSPGTRPIRPQEGSPARRSRVDRAHAGAGRAAEGGVGRDRGGASCMNAFLEFAERQMPAAVKARQRAAEKRRATAAEKALAKAAAEREDLFFLWRRWRKERLDALFAGPHAAAAGELVTFLNAMTLEDGARLVEFVRAAG